MSLPFEANPFHPKIAVTLCRRESSMLPVFPESVSVLFDGVAEFFDRLDLRLELIDNR